MVDLLEGTAPMRSVLEQRVMGGSLPYRIVKRCFDIICSFTLSVVLLLPMAVIAAAIFVKDRGNPFYAQERVGQNGRPIKVLKFRTMRVGADCLEETLTPEQLEEYWKEYKIQDDPRLIGYEPESTKECFGSRLRRSSMDELPQLFWNICIKGDMSMVGPRPILFAEMLTHYPRRKQKKLLAFKPGLTGYWQAYARNNAGYADGRRQAMEMYYVENASLWLDIKILLKTIPTVLRKAGV